MTNQLEIDFTVRRKAKKAADLKSRAADLIAVLEGRGWIPARQLHAAGFSDRELRDIVEHDRTGRIFSYPGSPGYRLFDESEIKQIAKCVALKNQGDKMRHRWIIYQRRLHGRFLREDAADGD